MVLKWVLFCYKKWSGLKINYRKNSLIFLGEISTSGLLISLVLNCLVQRLTIRYLGLPLTFGMLKKLQWRPLVERIKKRLAGWKVNLLSLGGRIT